MKRPSEVILETEQTRVKSKLTKQEICAAVGIGRPAYSYAIKAGLDNLPIRVDTLNKIRKELKLKTIKSQETYLVMDGE